MSGQLSNFSDFYLFQADMSPFPSIFKSICFAQIPCQNFTFSWQMCHLLLLLTTKKQKSTVHQEWTVHQELEKMLGLKWRKSCTISPTQGSGLIVQDFRHFETSILKSLFFPQRPGDLIICLQMCHLLMLLTKKNPKKYCSSRVDCTSGTWKNAGFEMKEILYD